MNDHYKEEHEGYRVRPGVGIAIATTVSLVFWLIVAVIVT